MNVAQTETSAEEPMTRLKPPRSWRAKFHDAFRGVKLGVRGHSSFSVHFFCAMLVVATAAALRCDFVDWCLLLLCTALVLVAEFFNSAVETLFHAQDPAVKARTRGALDIAAGAVLVASFFPA